MTACEDQKRDDNGESEQRTPSFSTRFLDASKLILTDGNEADSLGFGYPIQRSPNVMPF